MGASRAVATLPFGINVTRDPQDAAERQPGCEYCRDRPSATHAHRFSLRRVACALVYRILFNRQSTFDMSASFVEPPEHGSFWDGREAEPLLNGEYKIVLQLVGVLNHGKLAKRLTDRAIECVGHRFSHETSGWTDESS